MLGDQRQHGALRDPHSGVGMGSPSPLNQLPPHCCLWLQTGSPGSPFSPWKGNERSCQCPALGVPRPPSPHGSAVPHNQGTTDRGAVWSALGPCPHSRTPAHGATAQLTLGPVSPANARCPAWRESHCKERMCGRHWGVPCLGPTARDRPSTHPVVPWWSWWPHGTGHAWGPRLSGPARAPWHAWQPILALLTLRADGTGW